MNRIIKTSLASLMMILLLAQNHPTCAFDMSRTIKSVIFPGMGQLSDDQVVKGLSFMGLEVVLLSLTFNEYSKVYSYSSETEYLKVKYKLARTYEDRLKQYNDWNDAYTKHSKSKTNFMIFGALAGACWALNIADAVMFAPKEKASEQALLHELWENTTFSSTIDKTEIVFTVRF